MFGAQFPHVCCFLRTIVCLLVRKGYIVPAKVRAAALLMGHGVNVLQACFSALRRVARIHQNQRRAVLSVMRACNSARRHRLVQKIAKVGQCDRGGGGRALALAQEADLERQLAPGACSVWRGAPGQGLMEGGTELGSL